MGIRTFTFIFYFLYLLPAFTQGQIHRFYENSKVGYKNASNGEIIAPAIYSAGSEFVDGYAILVQNNKRGFINSKGEIFIPFIYDDASLFCEGLAQVRKGDKHGFINGNGEVILPFEFNFADDFNNGLARVSKDGKWGFIDKYGKEVIPLQFAGALNFSEELAPVKMKDGKWGYINKMGKFLIKGFFDVAHCFQHGEATVLKGNHAYIINKQGKKIREILSEEEEEAREHRK